MIEANQKKIDEFLAYLQAKNSSKNTVRGYKKNLVSLFNYSNKPPQKISQSDVIMLAGKLDKEIVEKSKKWERKRQNMSSASKQALYSSLSTFFKFIKQFELANEIISLRKQGTHRGKKIPVKLTHEELVALVNSEISEKKELNERNALLVKFLYATGIRRGEASEIKIKDFPKEPFQSVHLIKIKGKGDVSRRIVIPKWLLLDSKDFIKEHHRGISDFLFYSNKTKTDALVPWQIWNIIKSKARIARVEEDKIRPIIYDQHVIYPHNLRSTYATTLHEKGEDLGTIQELLGHASPLTTKIYTGITDETLKKSKTVEKI